MWSTEASFRFAEKMVARFVVLWIIVPLYREDSYMICGLLTYSLVLQRKLCREIFDCMVFGQMKLTVIDHKAWLILWQRDAWSSESAFHRAVWIAEMIFNCMECDDLKLAVVCRVGGVENFFHCVICGCCYALQLKDNHNCVSGAMQHDCPVCLQVILSNWRIAPCIFSVCEMWWLLWCAVVRRLRVRICGDRRSRKDNPSLFCLRCVVDFCVSALGAIFRVHVCGDAARDDDVCFLYTTWVVLSFTLCIWKERDGAYLGHHSAIKYRKMCWPSLLVLRICHDATMGILSRCSSRDCKIFFNDLPQHGDEDLEKFRLRRCSCPCCCVQDL